MTSEEELLGYIRILLRAFLISEQRLPSAEGRMSYSAHDFAALNLLADSPGCPPSKVAEMLEIAPTTASSLIQRLERNGFVRREKNKEDRRSVGIWLTEAGQDIQAAIHRQDISNMATILGALDPEERDQFLSMIGRIAKAIETA